MELLSSPEISILLIRTLRFKSGCRSWGIETKWLQTRKANLGGKQDGERCIFIIRAENELVQPPPALASEGNPM
jgi:hypothetical protein